MGKKSSSFFRNVGAFLSFIGSAVSGIFTRKNRSKKATQGIMAPKSFQTAVSKLKPTSKINSKGIGKPGNKLRKKWSRQAKSNMGPVKAHFKSLQHQKENGAPIGILNAAHREWMAAREKRARQRLINGRPRVVIKNGQMSFA